MITIVQLEKLEQDWIDDRPGKLGPLKSAIESVEMMDDVEDSIWKKIRELKTRIELYESPYGMTPVDNSPRERPYGGLAWPDDEEYDECSSWP